MRLTRRGVLVSALAAPGLAAAAAPRPLKLLILGGTGFIGPHQVRYALARGHQVTIFNRGRQKETWPGPVEELLGDRDAGDLKALQGRQWDACIDNPTTLPFWVRDAGRILAGNVGQYLFVSTVSAYADNHAAADETAPLAPYTGKDPLAETSAGPHRELYGPLKAASEAEARRRFGDRVTIVRPGLIAGPGDETDRFTYWPVRLARGGEIAAPGDGSDPVQFIDARDLAEWMVRLVERRTFGVFNATGPAHPLTMRALLADVAAGVKARPQLTWVPASVLDAEHVEAWSDMPVWVPGTGDDAGFARRRIDRALAAGLTFRSPATTAADTLAWFRTLPPERQAKLRAGLTPERETALLAKVHAAKG